MTTLSKNDKLQLIDSRKRNIEYKKYGLELDIIVENAKAVQDQDAITVINNAIDELDNQLTALNSEQAVVNATPDQE